MSSEKDVKIKCKDCGEEFVFTEKDQKFYEEKGFEPPKRCRNCRNARKDKNLYYSQDNKYKKF